MTTRSSRSEEPSGTSPLAHQTSAPKPVGMLLGAAAALALLFGLTYALFVRTRTGQWMDQQFLPSRADNLGNRPDSLRGTADTVLATFGNPALLAVLFTAIVLVGVVSRRGAAGVLGAAVTGGSIAVAGMLKQLMERPDVGVAGVLTHNSFPSGHVAAAAGVVCALLLAVPRRARWWCVLPGAAGVFVVGAATMIAGWHRLSDVIGSVLLAATLTCLAAAARRVVARAAATVRRPGDEPAAGTQRHSL